MRLSRLFAWQLFLVGLVACGGSAADPPGGDAALAPDSIVDGGLPSQDSASGTDTVRNDSAPPAYVVHVALAGSAVEVSNASFSRLPASSGYYDMRVEFTLGNGYSLSFLIIGFGQYPPPGVYAPAPNVATTMFKTADRMVPDYQRENWHGDGPMTIVASGEGGHFEGSATGTLTIPDDNPFTPPPPPGYKPTAYDVSWKKVEQP